MKASALRRVVLPVSLTCTLAALVALAACAGRKPSPSSAETHPLTDPSAIDASVDPCNDFFEYACGSWLKRTEIPSDRPRWSRSFDMLDEKNLNTVRGLLEGYAAGRQEPANPYAEKMGSFYAACMDESAVEKSSLDQFKDLERPIEKLTDKAALPALTASLHLEGVGALFDFGSTQDFRNPEEVTGVVDQGGLSLPDRDYYLSADKKMAGIRKMYREHIVRSLGLYGETKAQAAKDADTILRIETALAKASMSRVERRDPNKIYHRLERTGLAAKAPRFDWNEYFKTIGYPSVQAINVASPDFFAGMSSLLESTRLDDLKTYLRWHALSEAMPMLAKAFVNENFRFTSEALTGQKELPVRWKRCVKATTAMLTFAVGRAFVDLTYGPEGKTVSKEMITGIERAFGGTLKSLDWMDDPTREQAHRKLDKIFNKVGYPDKWRNYDSVEVARESYLKNAASAAGYEKRYDLDKIGKPLDRSDWQMGPSIVNAYYDPSLNEMVFPAGILQPPFFDRDAPINQNFGGIGMVMGHELTHGFDDQGRQFDADGRLRDWWTAPVGKKFDERAACLVKQYDGYTILDGVHLNGKLTLGENIADQGGIRLAYEAWRKESGTPAAPDTVDAAHPDKYQKERREFFLAFAQSWCAKRQDAYSRMLVTVDPHSPPRYRVNGPASNFTEFARAYGCKAGAPMAPVDRCQIW